MAPELPPIPVDQIAELDRKQAYYLLYDLIKDDFLTKKDFELHVGTMTASPPDFKVKDAMTGVYPMEMVFGVKYKLLVASGDVYKEGVVSAGEAMIS